MTPPVPVLIFLGATGFTGGWWFTTLCDFLWRHRRSDTMLAVGSFLLAIPILILVFILGAKEG